MPTYAKDIMTTELILGHPKMTVEEAIKTLVNNRITGIPVVDEKKRIIGVLSEYDIIKAVKHDEELPHKSLDLERIVRFSQKVVTITEDTHINEVLKQFTENKVRRLPVVNKKKQLVGIITRRDIMRVLFYRAKVL